MSLEGQNVQTGRYSLIPRTLTFLIANDRVLLIELDQSKGEWAGRYNGVGGHVERGEHPHQSAVREASEETGLEATDLRLCGTAVIDTQKPTGIALFVFVGRSKGEPVATDEGIARWIPLNEIEQLPLVDDLPIVLPRALQTYRGERPPFTALYSYDSKGKLIIELGPEERYQ